jgi:hypothetical protein
MRGEIAIPRTEFRDADPAEKVISLTLVAVVAVMLVSIFAYASVAGSDASIDAGPEVAMVMPAMP